MTRYEQGFMNKCAEYGVDGEELLKCSEDIPSDLYGISDDEARKLLKKHTSFKNDSDIDEAYREWRKARCKQRIIGMLVLGGVIGGAAGGPPGAAAGIGAGALAGAGMNAYAKRHETLGDMLH